MPTKKVRVADRDAMMNLLRDELYQQDIQMLANRIGVHRTTLGSIRSGRTKWPRYTTLLALIHVFDYELWLIREEQSNVYDLNLQMKRG